MFHFKVHSRKIGYQSPYLKLWVKDVDRDGSGELHEYYELEFPDFCNILAVTEAGELVMVRQMRAGVEALTLELPGGLVDSKDGDPQQSALRELREETGYAPLPGARVVSLGWTHPNPALQRNKIHGYITGPVQQAGPATPDPGETIEVVKVPVEEIAGQIRDEKITHALGLNILHLLMLREEVEGKKTLGEALRDYARLP